MCTLTQYINYSDATNLFGIFFLLHRIALHTNGYYVIIKEVSYVHQKFKKYLREEILSENNKWKTSKQQKETGMCKRACALRKTDIIMHKIRVKTRISHSCRPLALVDSQSLLKNRNSLSWCFITLATSLPCQQSHRRQQSKQQHRDSSGLDPELSSCPLENDETRSIYWGHHANWHLQRKMGNIPL